MRVAQLPLQIQVRLVTRFGAGNIAAMIVDLGQPMGFNANRRLEQSRLFVFTRCGLQTILTLCGLTVVVMGLGLFVFLLVGRGIKAGRIAVRGQAFDRERSPAMFWLILGLYGFAGASLFCRGLTLMSMMALYGIESAFR